MAPPTGRHAVIVANVTSVLMRQLQRPYRTPLGGGVARTDDDDEFRLPDVFVSCEPTPPVYFREPRLIVEVLSPSTEKVDLTEKLDFYRSLPSVEAVLLVWQDACRAQIIGRAGEHWLMQDIIGGGEFAVETLGVRLTLDEIYEGIEFPTEEP